MEKENNFAFIDGANLHCGMIALGWELDYKKFRIWLTDKYSVTRAYIFLGNIPKFGKLYTHLQECGYTLVFKEVIFLLLMKRNALFYSKEQVPRFPI